MAIATRKLRTQYDSESLVNRLLGLPGEVGLCLLDSCGIRYLESRYMIAGVQPRERFAIRGDASLTLKAFDELCARPDGFSFFSVSYDFGPKLERISAPEEDDSTTEPDLFAVIFDAVVVHDYATGETFLNGRAESFDEIETLIEKASPITSAIEHENVVVRSNYSRSEYVGLVEEIRERIREGVTYQTNLTQQLSAVLPHCLTPEKVFGRLRSENPAPFAAFLNRGDSHVVSASPERFFRLTNESGRRIVRTSPIKGTRPRGGSADEDKKLRRELLESQKDRAENVMIVDLLRNDLGRVCEFGSVEVEKLCDLEEYPTLFHLVSTVRGQLREGVLPSEILRAIFPCGSITGAPKISTMKIIRELENRPRGLSMGAIGFAGPAIGRFGQTQKSEKFGLDMSVAIRTMTIRGSEAVFNVGGGIVIDSDAETEYDETLTKAAALLRAINGKISREQNSASGV